MKHCDNEKGCGAAAALTTNRLIQRYSLPCAPVPCSVSMASSRFCWSGVRSGRICVSQLLEDHIRFGSRFLMNRLELRSHGSYERFDLALLRIGQLKRSRQHHGQVLWPVMAVEDCRVSARRRIVRQSRRPRHKR